MAKIIFALAAFLCCSFVAVSAIPAPRYGQDVAQDLDLDLRLNELQSLENLTPDQAKWMNATEILEKIEQALAAVEEKIAEVSKQVEYVVESILEGIENSALEIAANWNQAINEWAEKAAQAGVDVQDCINGQPKSIADVVSELKADAKECVAGSIDDLLQAVENVKAIGPEARELLKEARTKVTECTEKENAFATGLCLAGTLPPIQIQASGLMARAVWRAGVVGAKAAAIVPISSLCTTRATAGRAAEASAIAEDTVSCIKGKLGSSNTERQIFYNM